MRGHEPSFPYSGNLPPNASEAAARIGADPARYPRLSETERDFLQAGNRAQRRTAHWRYAMIVGLIAPAVAAMTAAGMAVHDGIGTTQQHAIALSRQLAAEGSAIDPADPSTAERLTASWRAFPVGRADSVMTTLLTKQQGRGVLSVSSSGVNGVAFSPDGKLLASADGDGTVRLWDLAPVRLYGPVLRADSGGQGGVNGVAFSPDGKLLASADADGTVRLWNPATGQLAGSTLQAGGGVNGVAFSPDGKMLAIAGADGTVLWNPATGQLVGLNSGDWFTIVASVIAIVVSALAVGITTRQIRIANRLSPG